MQNSYWFALFASSALGDLVTVTDLVWEVDTVTVYTPEATVQAMVQPTSSINLPSTLLTSYQQTRTTASPIAAAAPVTQSTTGQYSGDGTFYELGLTACGQTYSDSDYVAAISYLLFDQDGTPNPNSANHILTNC